MKVMILPEEEYELVLGELDCLKSLLDNRETTNRTPEETSSSNDHGDIVTNEARDEVQEECVKKDGVNTRKCNDIVDGLISKLNDARSVDLKDETDETPWWKPLYDFFTRNSKKRSNHDISVTAANRSASKETSEGKSGQSSRSQAKQIVQILKPANTELSCAFVNALERYAALTKKVEICVVKDVNNLDPKKPLIVICLNSSRLQPDVDFVTSPVKVSIRYVVIVLHVGSERNLPVLPSGHKLRGYDKITFVDMGFSYEGTIYQCRHNYEAVRQLISYVHRFYEGE